MIAVDRNHRENADQHQALVQNVFNRNIVRAFIIGREHQHAFGQAHHDIPTGGFHNDIAGEVAREGAAASKRLFKRCQLFRIGKLSEKQQIGALFKAEAVFRKESADQILDVDTAVIKSSLAGHPLPVYVFKRFDAGNIGQSGADAVSVFIAQSFLDLKAVVILVRNGRGFAADGRVVFAAGSQVIHPFFPPYTCSFEQGRSF